MKKEELLSAIEELNTRAKAICLVNLVTANRPNEMVRLRIKDFDLEGSFVRVYMRKQKIWHNKRLNHQTIKAVRDYISEYKLRVDDFFVGRVYKNGRFKGTQISETAYRNLLKEWTGLTPYNFRKTQVAAMHAAGADLSTIARQTGHKSLQTLDDHYLTVSDSTVDKYL
ncbi:tyrosine-type recombinase/integrase [Bacillus badius]|uniref:tyrosine-type recombinase/integrase n=1 Tax=Bacillus badius TaxID=1455 RepID=UPI001E3668B9|nr:site-specific integrase [Bacillus badius]